MRAQLINGFKAAPTRFLDHDLRSSTSLIMAQIQVLDSSLVLLWNEAISKYESDTGLRLDSETFDTAQAIYDYINQAHQCFESFYKSDAHRLRERARPILRALEALCGPLGDVVGLVFSPSKAIFSAFGLFLKGFSDVHDDFEAIGTAFDTLGNHLCVVHATADVKIDPTLVLRVASIKLLAQILKVLGVITKVRQDGRLKTWLKKLGDSKEIVSTLDDLGRLSTNHHQAVSALTLSTIQKTLGILTEGITWAEERQDVSRRSLARLMNLAQEVHASLKSGTSAITDDIIVNRGILERIQSLLLQHQLFVKDIQAADQIFRWLHCPDASLKMNELLRQRTPATGSWFLESSGFSNFKSGTIRTICLQGKAGCGKSTLLAAAIRDLQALSASSEEPDLVVAHFFDSTSTSQPLDLRSLLSAILCQLAHRKASAMHQLLRLHQQSMHGHSQPSLCALRERLDEMIYHIPARLFVAVDALDEPEDDAILSFLADLRAHENISLLVTSRKDVSFPKYLQDPYEVTIVMHEEVVNSDIKILIDSTLRQGGSLSRTSQTALVRKYLEARAEGNFRWTVLQIHELARIAGIPSKVRQRLKSLPKTLGDIYQRRLEAIIPDDRGDVFRLLGWLLYTCHPLSTIEFAQLLAFDYSEAKPTYRRSWEPTSPDDILDLVGSTFLSIHGDEVRLAHASVREFLLSLRSSSPFYISQNLMHSIMIQTSLAYIRSTEADYFPRPGGYHHHLSWTWVSYAAKMAPDQFPALVDDIAHAFADGSRREALGDILNVCMHTAAEIGCLRLLRLFIDRLGADVNRYICNQDYSRTALHWAVSKGQLDAAGVLINKGTDVDAADSEGYSPLHHAASSARTDLIQLLIDNGASLAARTASGSTPLHVAVTARGRRDAVALILGAGGDVELQDGEGHTALHLAVRAGDLDVVRLLIEHDADVRAVRDEVSACAPLHSAASAGHELIVRALLDAGADPTSSITGGWTPLHIAAYFHHVSIARLLLDRGAACAAADDGSTPLHLAAESGDSDLARLLLESGAQPSEATVDGFSPLHLAAWAGHAGIIRLLVDRCADVDARTTNDVGGLAPLHLAARNGHIDAVKLLLDAGADLMALTVDGWTPAEVANHYGHPSAAESLIDRTIPSFNGHGHGGPASSHCTVVMSDVNSRAAAYSSCNMPNAFPQTPARDQLDALLRVTVTDEADRSSSPTLSEILEDMAPEEVEQLVARMEGL